MMRRLLTLLFLLSPILGARADYSDPWGLPSGTVTLKLARQDSIQAGAPVHAFDFSMNHVDSLLAYDVLVAAGRADLLFVELYTGESEHWLRGPEDPVYELDRTLIFDLGATELGSVTSMAGAVDTLERFVPAVLGHAYVMLQIDAAAAVETTAVKLAVAALSDSTVIVDWVWQPNGEMQFIPSAWRSSSFSAVKNLY